MSLLKASKVRAHSNVKSTTYNVLDIEQKLDKIKQEKGNIKKQLKNENSDLESLEIQINTMVKHCTKFVEEYDLAYKILELELAEKEVEN